MSPFHRRSWLKQPPLDLSHVVLRHHYQIQAGTDARKVAIGSDDQPLSDQQLWGLQFIEIPGISVGKALNNT